MTPPLLTTSSSTCSTPRNSNSTLAISSRTTWDAVAAENGPFGLLTGARWRAPGSRPSRRPRPPPCTGYGRTIQPSFAAVMPCAVNPMRRSAESPSVKVWSVLPTFDEEIGLVQWLAVVQEIGAASVHPLRADCEHARKPRSSSPAITWREALSCRRCAKHRTTVSRRFDPV